MLVRETLEESIGNYDLVVLAHRGELRRHVDGFASPDLILTIGASGDALHPDLPHEDCLLVDADVAPDVLVGTLSDLLDGDLVSERLEADSSDECPVLGALVEQG